MWYYVLVLGLTLVAVHVPVGLLVIILGFVVFGGRK